MKKCIISNHRLIISTFWQFVYLQYFIKLTELIEELVANRSPMDSHVWKWAWLGNTIRKEKNCMNIVFGIDNRLKLKLDNLKTLSLNCYILLLGCSRRRRFRFLWHKRKTAIITILITPNPRPITTYSFISIISKRCRKKV